MDYWKQKATPWVSIAVLVGGMLSALILLWLVNLEASVDISSLNF